jgi:hypothetical protein
MNSIRNLFFPNLCHRCRNEEKNFLCEICLLGMELAAIEKGDVAHLFAAGSDFLLKNRGDYKGIIISYCTIQLEKLGWEYGFVYAEPQLLFLKKPLEMALDTESSNSLYLIHNKENPMLLKPIRKPSYILII